jgi:hypothetical protein
MMKASFGVRALVITVAAGSLLAVPFATSASAATQPASCGKITTKTVAKVIHITESKCLPASATGGGGTGTTSAGTGKLSGSQINTIKWASGHGTTKAAIKFAPNKKGIGKCAKGTSRLSITGKVLSSTGAAGKLIKAKQPVTASVCVNTKTSAVSLEPGTVEKL